MSWHEATRNPTERFRILDEPNPKPQGAQNQRQRRRAHATLGYWPQHLRRQAGRQARNFINRGHPHHRRRRDCRVLRRRQAYAILRPIRARTRAREVRRPRPLRSMLLNAAQLRKETLRARVRSRVRDFRSITRVRATPSSRRRSARPAGRKRTSSASRPNRIGLQHKARSEPSTSSAGSSSPSASGPGRAVRSSRVLGCARSITARTLDG